MCVLLTVAAAGCANTSNVDRPGDDRRPTGCDASRAAVRYEHGPRTEKRVALTFDDGPDRYTEGIADVLALKNVAATFFVLGKRVEGRTPILRRLVDEGHVLGNHGFSHGSLKAADDDAAGEIDRAMAAIQSASGFRPCLFRSPEGAESHMLYEMVRRKGMTTIYLDVDPRDWDPATSADQIERHVLDHVKPGSIVLLHDGHENGATLRSLAGLIDALRDRGYRFVTVPEMIGVRLT